MDICLQANKSIHEIDGSADFSGIKWVKNGHLAVLSCGIVLNFAFF